MGSPWYRPTRICHAVSGADFGWRSGSGKWPAYYEDSREKAVGIHDKLLASKQAKGYRIPLWARGERWTYSLGYVARVAWRSFADAARGLFRTSSKDGRTTCPVMAL